MFLDELCLISIKSIDKDSEMLFSKDLDMLWDQVIDVRVSHVIEMSLNMIQCVGGGADM